MDWQRIWVLEDYFINVTTTATMTMSKMGNQGLTQLRANDKDGFILVIIDRTLHFLRIIFYFLKDIVNYPNRI